MPPMPPLCDEERRLIQRIIDVQEQLIEAQQALIAFAKAKTN